MMTGLDFFFAKQLAEMRYEEALRTAEKERWLRAAGVRRCGWLAQRHCRLMYRLGRWLVARGKKLQRRYGVPALALEERAA